MTAKFMFSVDWLQLFCNRSAPELDPQKAYTSPRCDQYGNHRTYYLRPPREFLHGYRTQYRVMYKQYDVATIAYDHVDTRVSRRAAAIKAANAILYVTDWRFIIEDVMATFDMVPQNITRVDLCCDFNEFNAPIKPNVFMERYLESRHHKHDTYVRVGTDKYHIDGEKHIDKNEVQTIRWGSRSNGVSTYMYNKSLELQAHKYKKYIINAWEAAGLIYNDPKHPVWRVEFSISSKGVNLQDLELGEMHSLWLNDFDSNAKVRELFQVFAAKYFRFKIVPPTTQNLVKKDNLKDLDLFRFDDTLPLKPRTLCVSVDSGRTERLISRRLSELATSLEDASFMTGRDYMREALDLRQASDTFDEIAAIKHYRRSYQQEKEFCDAVGCEMNETELKAFERMRRRDKLVDALQHTIERNYYNSIRYNKRKALIYNKLGGGDVIQAQQTDVRKEVLK